MRTRVLSLRDVEGETIIDYALTLKVGLETPNSITINLSEGEVTLSKVEYLNKNKVFDNGKVFFILCTKNVTVEYAFSVLMQHAINKVETRIEKLKNLKGKYQKELEAA